MYGFARRRARDQIDALGLGGAFEQAGAFLQYASGLNEQLFENNLAGVDFGQVEKIIDDLQQHLRR